MNKIDLSKAKVGDKFRMRDGRVVVYKGSHNIIDKVIYFCKDENGYQYNFHRYGKFMYDRDTDYDLIEQVFDKPLDELIKEGTKQIKENDDAIAEENELQRRQEVVELAEKLLIRNLKDLAEYSYDAAFKDAEIFVKLKHKYLKDGKLC